MPLIIFINFLLPSYGLTSSTDVYTIEKKETIQKTFTFAQEKDGNWLIVDNIWGSVSVTGYKGNSIELTVQKTIQARSQEQLQYALKEISLDITQEKDFIELYVNGPFRCKEHRYRNHQWNKRHYQVIYDFILKVPFYTSIDLKTVMNGDIVVHNIQGDFDVHNVNSGIDMKNLQGSGEAYAVNGDVSLQFIKNPRTDCCFGSLNGEVKLYFQPKLSADFYLKTFNGEIFSDYPVSYLPAEHFSTVEKNGKTVYKAGHLCGVRAGKGGPKIKMKGFNGDMFILKHR